MQMQGVAASANVEVCTDQRSIWSDNPTVNKNKKRNVTPGKWVEVLTAKHYGNSKFASIDAARSILSKGR
jgi:hypothetical protein